MSDTVTHSRGEASPLNLITGEPPGIKEILEKRAAEGNPPPADPDPPERKTEDDPATIAANEVAALRRRATEAEARSAESERARIAAETTARNAVQGAEETGFTAITTTLASATREKEALIADLKAAGEAGEFGKMGEINVRLGELGAEIRDLQMGKQQFEQDRATRLQERPREASQPQAGSATERQILAGLRAPSKDAFLSSRTPETREFLNQHPEFFSDPAAHQRMIGAESLARGRGLAVDSPEYFNAIRETALGQTTSQPPPRREQGNSAPPGTPPSREAPSPTGRRAQAGDVYVSPEQAALADWMKIDRVEYAKEEAELRQRNEIPYRRR